ncbi:quinone-dependent dihydroorotate dehydrogenase [Derxia gummosa]|uniref:Dihydroorotate dehydrogenase (quinone) n=1 Tax=Derxia gummosa DSM 723 TaxID=1121388 RepID=A0A8B6X7K6_9BURK|nr:quinone-dependent dihydroorotate dehydrogenase [Derxia gummosa]
MSLYSLARPLLFLLDPEKAHHVAFGSLDTLEKLGLPGCLMQQRIAEDAREVMGIRFPNPVGLAAGLDKDGEHIDALSRMGFGFIEVGTVTPKPQAGNAQPRLFRLPEANAIINRMGFNNGGVDAFVRNVQRSRFYQQGGVLGLNIGKNAGTPIEKAADDYLHCLERVYPYASYVTVNISSPNTKNLRQLQGGDELDALLAALMERRDRLADQHGKRIPLALKIAPDLDSEQIARIADLLVQHRVDGVIATNTTLARDAVKGLRHADEAGGLSGAPVKAGSDRVIAALHARLGNALPIIGVGGIFGGQDAADKIAAGARLVQVYTGLIYRGPELVADCARALRTRV